MSFLQNKKFKLFAICLLGLLLLAVYTAFAAGGPQRKAIRSTQAAKIDPGKLRVAATKKVQLFGHVTLVEGYNLSNFRGCHALIKLRDTPGKTIAVLTTRMRLQSLLETGLSTGNLICIWGNKLLNPPAPRGGTWSVEVYKIDGVILYNMK
ncbi:MAG: hypothetical protein KAW12_16390 [Candidatus Aminicenantes bacterium]|nr:hypothetical protein [Candidatus Aminicenantes bacterium]